MIRLGRWNREARDAKPGRADAEAVAYLGQRIDDFAGGLQQLRADVASDLATFGHSVDKTRRATAAMSTRLDAVEHRLQGLQRRLETHLGAVEGDVADRRAETEPDFERFHELAVPVVEAGTTLLGYERLHILWQAIRNVAPLRLPAAELGVYRGGSAEFIAAAFRALAEGVDVHAFDTFAGHPESSVTDADSEHHVPGRFGDVDGDEVQERLSGHPNLHVHVGDVLETLPAETAGPFSLVHIDVDLYRPTLESLRLVRDRLVAGSVVLVDDFGARKCPGIAKAVEEFLGESSGFHFWKPPTEQAVLIKVSDADPPS